MSEQVHFVRHVDYHYGGLTELGWTQSEAAWRDLEKTGLGAATLVLSSKASPAMCTAQVIAAGLGAERVLPSAIIEEAGQDPKVVRNLDTVLQASLAEHGLEIGDAGLVVVTHRPLIASLKGGSIYDDVQEGEVVPYDAGSWSYRGDQPDTIDAQRFEALCQAALASV